MATCTLPNLDQRAGLQTTLTAQGTSTLQTHYGAVMTSPLTWTHITLTDNQHNLTPYNPYILCLTCIPGTTQLAQPNSWVQYKPFCCAAADAYCGAAADGPHSRLPYPSHLILERMRVQPLKAMCTRLSVILDRNVLSLSLSLSLC